MKSKFLYLVLMLFTVYVEIMYDGASGIMFLGFELLLLVCMLLLSFSGKRHLRAAVIPEAPAVAKGQMISLRVVLENTGRLPIGRVEGNLAAADSYGVSEVMEELSCALDGKQKISVESRFPARYCGRSRIWLKDGKVSDYLGLFKRRFQDGENGYITVLPDIYPMQVEVGQSTRNFPVDGEEYDPHRSGDDSSEIFQIREYRPGDSLHRIHWKMTAKADDLMTKEYGLPVGCCVLLLMDLYHPKERAVGAREMDRMLETFVSVSCSLAMEGCIHYCAWFEQRGGKIRRFCVKEEEQVYEMADLLMGALPYTMNYGLEEGYHAEYPEGRYATQLRLDTELKLWKNGTFYADFSQGELKHTLEQMVLEI